MRQSADRVEALGAELPALLEKLADQRANRRGIRAILKAPQAEMPGTKLRHLQALRTLYNGQDDQLRWMDYQGVHAALNASGKQLFKGLETGVFQHGIWSDELHFRALESMEFPDSQEIESATFEHIRLREDERVALMAWMAARPALDRASIEDRVARLAELITQGAPLARLNAPVEAQAARLSAAARASSRMDILLSDALIQYALRMRFENPAWHKEVAWPLALQDGAPPAGAADASAQPTSGLQGEALLHARRDFLVMRWMEAVFADPTRVAGALEGLAPPFEPYRRLTRAFQKYNEYVEAGGWPELPEGARGLRQGDMSPWVATLKSRLNIEGYYQGDISQEFDQNLRQALLTYQRTHQLPASGRLSDGTIRSLNVSALQRRHQIQLTLQRWRESRIGADEHFVLVNLPDFHASVWRGGERQMYFAVVVGGNRRAKKGNFPRETPRFSDEISHIVFNPYWNVTKNIRELEVEPRQARDPGYFEREGFEYFISSNGHRLLRQKPGPSNALGQVKFIFPNKYNIYLHDTPDKSLFEKPHRAFSHGCVRIENPMDFAHYLLDYDGRWMGEKRAEALEKWLAKDSETWVNLSQNLPIHIEYYVVRVDDEGRANFLSDLYALDEPRLKSIAHKYEGEDLSKIDVDAQAQQLEDVD